MADPLASATELANVPGVDLAGVSEATIDQALQLATSAIIADLGWDPRETEATINLRPTPYVSPVFIPALNVTEVAATIDGVPVDPLDWTTPSSIVYLAQPISTSGTVVYTAGWPEGEIPEAIRDACLQRAAEILDNPHRLVTWHAGEAGETYSTGDSVTPVRDPRLAPYRIMAIA